MLNMDDEVEFQEQVRKEKEKLIQELESMETELEEKNKELIMIEIKNEVLKRMLFEESEKYKKYAEYDF